MVDREEFLSRAPMNHAPRTKELLLYTKHVDEVRLNRAKEKGTGVRNDSPLHKSKYFHCTSNFIFVPMHDLLEGICPMEMKLVLHH